jgi:hypothetical protein
MQSHRPVVKHTKNYMTNNSKNANVQHEPFLTLRSTLMKTRPLYDLLQVEARLDPRLGLELLHPSLDYLEREREVVHHHLLFGLHQRHELQLCFVHKRKQISQDLNPPQIRPHHIGNEIRGHNQKMIKSS